MKKQRLFKLAALLVLCCVMFGCGKDNIVTKIYGTVFDMNTGEPVRGAEISFRIKPSYSDARTISSSVSGTDGQYEISFGKLPEKDASESYQVLITHTEYFSEVRTIQIEEGYSHRVDINLEPK